MQKPFPSLRLVTVQVSEQRGESKHPPLSSRLILDKSYRNHEIRLSDSSLCAWGRKRSLGGGRVNDPRLKKHHNSG